MYLTIHIDSLSSMAGAWTIFIFTFFSLIYVKFNGVKFSVIDLIILQLGLVLFLIGYAFYSSLKSPDGVLFWSRICYAGAALTVSGTKRFSQTFIEEKKGYHSFFYDLSTLILIIAVFLPGELIFTSNLNPAKSHSSVIKGPFFISFVFFILANLLFISVRISILIFRKKNVSKLLIPVFGGFFIFLLSGIYNAFAAAIFALTTPNMWIGPTALAFGLALFLARTAMENHEKANILMTEKKIMYHNMIHDSLTGLFTRDYMLESIEQAVFQLNRHERNVTLVFLDIDNFKLINDQLGHNSGDEVLRNFGSLLLMRIRKGDLAARLGGDEFLLLLFDCGETGSRKICHTIQDEFRKYIDRDFSSWKHHESLSLSMGLLAQDQWSDDPDEIIHRADKAMYQAKRNGKNRICRFDMNK